jgi:prepilin-type N-terminal cleavage/methylation domain-containing protein
MEKENRLKAFTLAEVLITLGIIGVVASLTIPTLMQNQQEQATVVAVKKAYTELSQAYTMAVKDNGTPDNWGLDAYKTKAGGENILKVLSQYLNLSKNCLSGTGCAPDVTYKAYPGADWINVNSDDTFSKASLSDGSLLIIQSYGDCLSSYGPTLSLGHVCGSLRVDINGNKQPNQMGVDLFGFYLTLYGIVPFGTPSVTSLANFNDGCKSNTSGDGCTAWVLYNGNLDYRKCPTQLSWEGNHSCK